MAERRTGRAGARRPACLAVISTVATRAQARRLAREVVQRQLAACVHIVPTESVYRWEGRLQQEQEYRLICKTTRARREALMRALLASHPYQLPALYAIQLAHVHGPYADWVGQGSRPGRRTRK